MEPIALFIFLSVNTVLLDIEGTYIDVGVALHSEQYDDPEFIAPNPIGLAEIGYTRGRWNFAVSHDSSFTNHEYGYGYNKFSVKYRLWQGRS